MQGATPLRNSRYKNLDISTEDAIVFLQRNPQYLQHEANPYSVDKLMMLLDNDKLSALEEEFNEHPNGIDLPDFVLLLKSTIVHPPEDKFKLVSGLIKLFQDIDINGDGHMEWSEFTQYIIDAVIGEKDTKFFDARFEKDREFTEHEILDKAYSRKTKRYVMSKTIDNTIHLSLIKKVAYCSHNDLLAVLEEGAKKIKMYTSSNATIKDTFEPVFEEKAFILDCCYSEKLNMVGCISSDRKVIIWENISVKKEPLGSTQDYFSAGIWDSTPMTKKEIVNVKQDVLPTGIWYLENHKVWIVAGADNGLRSFAYGTSDKNPSPYDKAVLLSHTRKITEVTEISIPKLVASSSLDGTIKLWDLADKVLMTELKDGSTSKGIRGITYSFDYGGNLLSFGFENHINIWCPEVSLTRSYVGKLEGHSHTIVCCKFIPGSPNCVSADEKGNIRIWDIRSLTTIQLISAENSSVLVTDLTIIPKHDKFIISGKRMTFYDNSAVSKSIKHFNEDLYPIYCTYNQYYQTIIVLTKIDLRVYDVLTGKLRKVFTDLTDERFNTSDLSSFTFGGKQRKFYIGDNSGLVRVYNMKNGEYIHKVNKFNEEQELDKKKETERKKNSKRRENAEISQIVYLTDEKLLITASWDSTIRIYDESEPDESILLRIMSGGHRESDINAMAYSSHLNLLASGSGNGLISVWDLELGKLDQICLGHTAEITCLQFAEPFPILISGSADGTICVWGVRPCSDQYRHKCILRILNSSWKEDGSEIRAGITNLTVETDLRVGVEREKILKGFPNPQEYYEYVFRPTEKKQQESKLYATNVSKSNYKSSNESEDKEKSYLNAVNEDCRALGIEFLEETLYFPLNRPTDNNDYYETLDDYAKYREMYDTEEKQKKRRCYVYYGDQKGFMNLLDLTEILRKRDIGPCKSEKRTDSYQLRRKEWLDASKQVENQLSNEKLRKTPYSVHTFNTVLLRRWEGHTQPITHIAKVDDPRSIITCSLDKYVKIWSLEGELFGSFNLLKLGKKAWEFPFDWGRHKLREVEDAFTVLNFIEKEETEALTPDDRELIKFQYLATSFDNENDFLRAVKSYKNYGTYLEKKPETPVKEKEPERKDIEIPAYLQAEIEDKDRERDRIKDKDKNKGKLKGKGKEEKPLQIDTRDPLADYKRNFATEYKGLAQKVLVSIEKFEKQVNKDQKKEPQGPTQHQPTKTMSKQKTEIRIRSSKIRGLDPTESIIKIMGGDKKKDEKSTIASRVASSLSKRIGTASQNFRSPGGHLPAIEGTLHEGITTEDVVYNPKGNLTTASRASSARPLFSNFSSKTFKKNLDHATTLVKSYTRPQTHKSAEPDDIKFRQGEGLRSLKIAARKQIEKFDSASPQIFADEREALASRSEFYRNLRSKNNPNTGDAGNLSDRSTGRDDNYKIIANRLFMEDPEKNKMKVLKSNNRLYVL